MGSGGWSWAAGTAIRWGTNRISTTSSVVFNTESFEITFDQWAGSLLDRVRRISSPAIRGGGAFIGAGASSELVGILFARASFVDQPANTSIYGNLGYIVDLYDYRNDIVALIDQPDCSDGLDDDLDGIIDFPLDPGCVSPTDDSEADPVLDCDNGIDDDNDGLTDLAIRVATALRRSERGAIYECDNGIDDDGDVLSDFPDDDGCLHPTNLVEAPEPNALLMLLIGSLALVGRARRARS